MKKNRLMWWLLLYGFLFFLGSSLAYIAYIEFQKTSKLLEYGIRTTATVTSFSTHDSDGTTMYTPTFVFLDKSKQKQTFTSGISSSPPAYQIGEKVKIIYDRNDIANVKTISFWGLYRGSIILSMIASPLLVIGSAYLIYRLY